MSNTKRKGNRSEAEILAQFVKLEIPVSLPFGDNEKYDLVAELGGQFKAIQVKSGRYVNGVVTCDARHRVGNKRLEYETYKGKADYIAIWCKELEKAYLVPCRENSVQQPNLRVDPPKNNSCINQVIWARDFEFSKQIRSITGLEPSA